ncbi:MAG: hypothetical protein EBY42_08130 [Actinobacteria bacterium]|nr:hypothetical protein [Actinomycetota bacterium]
MPDPPFSESVALLADVGLCGAGANEAPHEPQNVDPAIVAWLPHLAQNTGAGAGAGGGDGAGSGAGAGLDSGVGSGPGLDSGVGSGVGDP